MGENLRSHVSHFIYFIWNSDLYTLEKVVKVKRAGKLTGYTPSDNVRERVDYMRRLKKLSMRIEWESVEIDYSKCALAPTNRKRTDQTPSNTPPASLPINKWHSTKTFTFNTSFFLLIFVNHLSSLCFWVQFAGELCWESASFLDFIGLLLVWCV